MTFIIKYEKTGKEIEMDDKRAYLRMSQKELEALGFSSRDIL